MLQIMTSTCVILSGSSGNIFNASCSFDVQRASRSLLRQVYVGCVFGVFFGLVFGCVFCSFLGASKTVLEPNMAPTRVDFGARLVMCWSMFGCSFAVFIS